MTQSQEAWFTGLFMFLFALVSMQYEGAGSTIFAVFNFIGSAIFIGMSLYMAKLEKNAADQTDQG